MPFIILKKDNTLVERYWDDDNVIVNEPIVSVNTNHIFRYLNHAVLLEEGFTLRNFFIIMRNSYLNILHPAIDNYLEEVDKCNLNKRYANPDFEYLEAMRFIHGDYYKNIDYKEGVFADIIDNIPFHNWVKNIDITDSFHVINKLLYDDTFNNGQEFDINNDNHKLNVGVNSVSFCSIGELLDLEIRIGNLSLSTMEVNYNNEDDRYKRKYFIDSRERNYFTLFDFIQCIMEDISALGDDPSERDEQIDIVYERYNQVLDEKKNSE